MRLSTNQKLAQIVNGPDDDEDEEEKLYLEEKAKARLRRSSLYGGGARTKVPRVKHKKKSDQSPFTVLEPVNLPPSSTAITTTVPPGAHYDQFRLVSNLTQKSLNDPDRIFIDSSSMRDGIVVVPGGQPPWYFGRNNKTKPPDGNYATMAASRYGFRGSKGIRQRHVEPYERPSNTRTEYTPSFLIAPEDTADEWVPPILATTIQTVNGMESPKLWPENTDINMGINNLLNGTLVPSSASSLHCRDRGRKIFDKYKLWPSRNRISTIVNPNHLERSPNNLIVRQARQKFWHTTTSFSCKCQARSISLWIRAVNP